MVDGQSDEVLPSEADTEGREWIVSGLKKSGERLEKYMEVNEVEDPNEMDEDKSSFPEEDPKVRKIDQRAVKDGYLSGKWEITIEPQKVD
ncbi:MAG: hypothetical protein ACOC55_00705, partial [Candidatus Natronoplasma sp.]